LKTKFYSLILSAVLTLFAFSPLFNNYAQAISCESGFVADSSGTICLPSQANTAGGPQNISQLILRGINILLAIAATLAILYLIIGGYQYITSAGNEEAAKKGQTTVVNALIGIAIIVLSFTIVTLVSRTVSGAPGTTGPFF